MQVLRRREMSIVMQSRNVIRKLRIELEDGRVGAGCFVFLAGVVAACFDAADVRVDHRFVEESSERRGDGVQRTTQDPQHAGRTRAGDVFNPPRSPSATPAAASAFQKS